MTHEEWEDLSTSELAQRLMHKGVDPDDAYQLSRYREQMFNRRAINGLLSGKLYPEDLEVR